MHPDPTNRTLLRHLIHRQVHFVRHESNDAEDDEPGEEGSRAVSDGDHQRVSTNKDKHT